MIILMVPRNKTEKNLCNYAKQSYHNKNNETVETN